MNPEEKQHPSAPTSQADPPPPRMPASTQPPFDPSRMIGIIKRKALTKELAAVHHAGCLAYCQELLELQKKWEEELDYQERILCKALLADPHFKQIKPLIDIKSSNDLRKETIRPPKRVKRTR